MSRRLRIAILVFGLPAVPLVWYVAQPAPDAPNVDPRTCAEMVWATSKWIRGSVSSSCREWCCRGVWPSKYRAETKHRAQFRQPPIVTPDADCKSRPWYEIAGLCRCASGKPHILEREAPCLGNVYVPRGLCAADVLLEWPGGQQVGATETCLMVAKLEGVTARCYESASGRRGARVEAIGEAPCLESIATRTAQRSSPLASAQK